jgi:tetratricopeptide (TPR) repeat protein
MSGISLAFLLYLAPTTPASETNVKMEVGSAMESEYDLFTDVTEVRNDMEAEVLAYLDKFESAASSENTEESSVAFDSLITVFDTMRKPEAAAYYLEQKAMRTGTQEDWTVAAERFMILGKYMGENLQKAAWYKHGSEAYKKALELDPQNVNLQIDLAVTLVEGSGFTGQMPMEGIGILRKAIELEPQNAKGHFYLGYFAERSGQLDKAMERYGKVLELDPENKETHLYMAQVCEKQENKDGAIGHLTEFRGSLTDPKEIAEVDQQIESLKN